MMRSSRTESVFPVVSVAAIAALIVVAAGCGPSIPADVKEAARSLPAKISFSRHVKPILSDRCFKCHGPDANTRKTDLRFDTEDGAYARLTESRRKKAIEPGKTRSSEMIYRIVSDDPEYRMPPPESNLSLTAEEIAVLTRWIEQGAEFEKHWSLIKPDPSPDPLPVSGLNGESDARNEIDYFIRARLEREGLRPAPEATREQLIRRLSFDLTGLPPSIDEIDDFLNDSDLGAYERVVDRLLSSSAYGERMAATWLDLARYADSHGYQDDGWRNMWPWRDWVIKSFNDNMPYDQFVTWQLAGDLLDNPTQDQRLATGFNRNHLQSQEGGIVPEEYRVDYVVDRTNTFGKAFLGLTVECAQCHDHKFDPVSQKDYYGIFAFFNSVNEYGSIPYAGEASPVVILTDTVTENELTAIRAKIDELESVIRPDHDRFTEGFESWRSKIEGVEADIVRGPGEPHGMIGHYPLDGFMETDTLVHLPELVEPGRAGYFSGDRDNLPTQIPGRTGGSEGEQESRALHLEGDGWLDTGDERYRFERNDPFSIALWFRTDSSGVSGPLFSKSGSLFNGHRGYVCLLNEDGTISASLNHVFPDNSIKIQTVDRITPETWQQVVMTYDGSSRADGLRLYLDGIPMESRVRVDNLQQSILFAIDPATGDTINWGGAGNLRVGYVGGNSPKLEDVAVDDFKIFDRRLTEIEVAMLANPSEAPRPSDRQLREYYVEALNSEYRKDFEKLYALRGQENSILTHRPGVMVMRDLPEPRASYVLTRGAYDAPGELVEPSTPDAILKFPDDYPRNRLGLAKWLFHEENPLTARVAVNRLWQQVFGRGLVETSDNFGSQGSMPSHPDLLDFLAVEYRASEWDTKAMLKRLVLSATYKQSSLVTDKNRSADPDNLWLAHATREQLSAEMIRDNALASSDLLVRDIGGPSVKPYQPPGLWKEQATRNATEYVQDHGDKLYRRSLYTVWKRTTPPPSMISFDASERNLCIIRRQTTSTPLQALVLLNDPQYIEASRILAERMIRTGGDLIEDQITYGFRMLTSRYPDAVELEILTTLYESERDRFAENDSDALALLATGEFARDAGLNVEETAALTVVANTIMNFDESVTKR